MRKTKWAVMAGLLCSGGWAVAQEQGDLQPLRGASATGLPVKTQEQAAMDPSQCPVIGGTQRPANQRSTAAGGLANRDWWPNQLNLQILQIRL